jgi:RNase P subunit RPR2
MGKDALARYREFQRRLAQYTQELSAEMFPEGLPEGLTFSDLEEAAERVGNQVSRDLMERHIQARPEGAPATCPECDGPLKPGQDRDRRLTTTRGRVSWTEKTTHCPRCRRAFSPSGPNSGA